MVLRMKFNVGDYVDAIFRFDGHENDGVSYKATVNKLNWEEDGTITYDIDWSDGDLKDRTGKSQDDLTIVKRQCFKVGDKVSCRFNKPTTRQHGKYYDATISEVVEAGVCYTVDWDDGDTEGKFVGYRDMNLIYPAPPAFAPYDLIVAVYNNEDSDNNGAEYNARVQSYNPIEDTYIIDWEDGDENDRTKVADDLTLLCRPQYRAGDAVKAKYRWPEDMGDDGNPAGNGRYYTATIAKVNFSAEVTYDIAWGDDDARDTAEHPEGEILTVESPAFAEGQTIFAIYRNTDPDSDNVGNDGKQYEATVTEVIFGEEGARPTYNIQWGDGEDYSNTDRAEQDLKAIEDKVLDE